jgi:hypothetical protein
MRKLFLIQILIFLLLLFLVVYFENKYPAAEFAYDLM